MMDGECDRRIALAARRARAGNLAAFRHLVELTQAHVYGIAIQVLRDPDAAQDVVQETYFTVHRKLATLADAERASTWIRRIATRLALNHKRGLRLHFVQLSDDLAGDATNWECGSDPAVLLALDRALLALSGEERRLCERFYRGGSNIERLAADASISTIAMRKRMSRVRARLREEIIMNTTRGTAQGLDEGLPDKIVKLLARPRLTDMPENPVGAVWSVLRESLPDFEEMQLPETIALSDVAAVVGEERMRQMHYSHHQLDSDHILRSDTSMPILIEVAKRPGHVRRVATGKVYRDDPVDHRHLEAFHQLEVLSVGEQVSEWQIADWLTAQAKKLLHDNKLRIDEIDFPFMCSRAFELHVSVDDEWIEVAAFGRFHDDIARRLGGRGARAVGAGIGLDRWAQLAYGIDDIRKVEGTRLPLDVGAG